MVLCGQVAPPFRQPNTYLSKEDSAGTSKASKSQGWTDFWAFISIDHRSSSTTVHGGRTNLIYINLQGPQMPIRNIG